MPETEDKDSILQSTKKMVGIEASVDAFDLDIITHINSAFSTLYQAGVGPVEGYSIEGTENKWAEFIGNRADINNVKSYIYQQVRYDFDPPPNSFGQTAVKERIQELIWRLNVAADFTIVPITDGETGPTAPEIPAGKLLVWDLTNLQGWPDEAVPGDFGVHTGLGYLYVKTAD